jgi:hypothetical protein
MMQRLPEYPLPPPRADSHDLARSHARAGIPIRSDAIAARWKGESLDLDHAVTALFCLLPEPSPDRENADPGDPATA